ncbi:MAG: MBL fold metallo-hydrolase [Clostridia bacterium]|nr:MBL fold metallo-hydrolase [Clostridia bacterium]
MKVLKFILGNMQTNCYFLINEPTGLCAVVDPADEYGRIAAKLAEKNLTIDKILLTHAHFDHIMALRALREKTGAPLYVHKDDVEMLTDPKKSLMASAGGCSRPEDPPEHAVSDGDVIPLGTESIRVMHTPGHTKGSVCYIVDDIIISGDTLFRGSIGRYDFYGGDYGQMLASLDKLKALDGDYRVYPGHGSSTTLEHEKETNYYLM